MTILIFLGSMIGAMALGVPIAFSLLLCGAALMWHLNMFDAQILAQNVINGADSFPLLAHPAQKRGRGETDPCRATRAVRMNASATSRADWVT